MAEPKIKYQEIVQKLKVAKILVVGDVMLDLYIRGEVERISPEAPVPILVEKTREYSLGGAGNVAANIAALGAKVTLLGVVGNDVEGKMIKKVCLERGIAPRFVSGSKRPTTLKMRIVSGHHQLSRVDREHIDAITKAVEKKVSRVIDSVGDQDMIVVSDYAKGFVTESLVRAVKKRFGGKKISANIKPMPVAQGGTLTFKGIDVRLFRGINAITMNANEGRFYSGVDTSTDKGAASAASLLAKKLNTSVVLTRGSHGLTAYDIKAKKNVHIANRALHVFDVTGAGDTVVSTLVLMLASGIPLFKAAEIANHAGGIVVGRRGTATISPTDLRPFLE